MYRLFNSAFSHQEKEIPILRIVLIVTWAKWENVQRILRILTLKQWLSQYWLMLKQKTKTYQKFMVECLGKKLLNIVTNLIGKNKKLKYWKKYRSKNGKNILKICFSLRLVELISDITLKHTKSKKRQQSSNFLMRKIILQSRSLRIQWIYLLTQ